MDVLNRVNKVEYFFHNIIIFFLYSTFNLSGEVNTHSCSNWNSKIHMRHCHIFMIALLCALSNNKMYGHFLVITIDGIVYLHMLH